jgi:hypothetical protein
MATSTLFIIPFQVILSWLILRRFRGVIPAPVYSLVVIALVIDLAAMFNPNLFPLSSYLITVALLRYYGKSWWSVRLVSHRKRGNNCRNEFYRNNGCTGFCDQG